MKSFSLFLGISYLAEMYASYTTSFQCFDGSYALIGGADLTLKYQYGLSYDKVRITLLIISDRLCSTSFISIEVVDSYLKI